MLGEGSGGFLSFVFKLHILSQMEILSSNMGIYLLCTDPKKEALSKKGKDFNRN